MTQPSLFDVTLFQSAATISECGLYRYDLRRTWETGPHVTFLMFNPSRADHEEDDHTITKCIGFAKRWGYSGIIVVNLYAYRATDVRDLWKAADPVGPLNDAAIVTHACFGLTIAAWGAKPKAKARVAEVRAKLAAAGRQLHVIRMTASGHPEHPLMLPYGLKPFPMPEDVDR